ncbi:hypothetical protein [Hydrocarboniphaga sp.]|uniref:hypothetical protein n=1 Tax=Hydrocarboniphaga sp. TaxID=2033016 RepID=UPI003D0D6F67
MSPQLEISSGPRFVKPAIVGVLALMFAGGIYAVSQSSSTIEKKPAEPQTAMAADGSSSVAAVAPASATTEAAAPAVQMSAEAAPEAAMATPPVAEPAIAPPEPAAPQPKARPAEPADTEVAVKDEQPDRDAVRPPATPAVEALRPWWGQAAGDDRFGVQYVGQAADQPTLVIRFSRQVTNPMAAQNIKLIGANGQPVAANWAQGQSPNVLYAPNLQAGRYTVVIDPQLASTDGQALGTQLHGPTYIR